MAASEHGPGTTNSTSHQGCSSSLNVRPRVARPEAAVRAVPARLLLLCLLLRSSWLTVEGDRHVGAAGVLHNHRGGRAAVAVGSASLVAFRGSRPVRGADCFRFAEKRLSLPLPACSPPADVEEGHGPNSPCLSVWETRSVRRRGRQPRAPADRREQSPEAVLPARRARADDQQRHCVLRARRR